jgi:hypothetical protein
MQGWESLSHEQFRADSKRSNQKVQGAVLLALDDQILNGNGVGTNLTGILQTAGIQTQAKGADTMVNGILSLFVLRTSMTKSLAVIALKICRRHTCHYSQTSRGG